MLPKYSDRAAARCTSHIVRFYPAWKQAQIRHTGEGLEAMEDFIDRCKAHLSDLRAQIGEGDRPDIDRGWPAPDAAPKADLKPETVIQEVKVPDPEAIARLEETERKLTAAQAELAKRELIDSMDGDEPIPDEPPAGIADMFHPDRPYAEQAQALWKKYNELTQKIMMGLADEAERRKHGKLQGDLDWIKHHAFEAV